MTAITAGRATVAVPASAVPARLAGKPSLLSRAWAAFLEARMRQAEREIAQHRHLLPGQFQVAAERLAPSEKDLPFVR